MVSESQPQAYEAWTPPGPKAPQPFDPAQRPPVSERGLAATAPDSRQETGRIILYERLAGNAARERARTPEPQGAGLPPDIVERVEYVEAWSTKSSADGFDFRMYSFGGALIALRSIRTY
jgi:hypothetical protein